MLLFDFAVVADPGPQGLTFIPSIRASRSGPPGARSVQHGVVRRLRVRRHYSEECREPRKTVARATYIAVGLVATMYAISSWLLAVSIGPDSIVDPRRWWPAASPRRARPIPTTCSIGAGTKARFLAISALLLFATSLFAALISFHNAVARYVFSLGANGSRPRPSGACTPHRRALIGS